MLSDRVELPALVRRSWMLPALTVFVLGLVSPLAAQDQTDLTTEQDTVVTAETETTADSLVGAAVSVGSDEASLELQLADGRTVQLELAEGVVYADGQSLGTYDEGGSLDRSWRALLDDAAMASTAELPVLLREWDPPAVSGTLGQRLDERLEQALAGVGGRLRLASTRAAEPLEDSLEKLLAHIEELEEHDDEMRHYESRSGAERFVNDFAEGLAWLFAALVWFAVLFGIGAAMIFFGDGRIERVSQTVRDEPLRAWLIGVAAAFLAIPFYVLVMLALAISILGIPLILAWAPLFPLLMVLAAVTGWLAVAYSFGERMVRRKLSERPRFQNAGATHHIAVGIALLLSPFVLAAMFQMTSFLEGIGIMLFVLGLIGNVLLAAMGFGAVMIRGAGAWERRRDRRASERRALAEQDTPATEGTNV